jgi:hypothetical protein
MRVDDELARLAVRRSQQRLVQRVEADRRPRQRVSVDVVGGEQRERVVDLGGGVVRRAADVELGVVQRLDKRLASGSSSPSVSSSGTSGAETRTCSAKAPGWIAVERN